jgi:hypothetical protein
LAPSPSSSSGSSTSGGCCCWRGRQRRGTTAAAAAAGSAMCGRPSGRGVRPGRPASAGRPRLGRRCPPHIPRRTIPKGYYTYIIFFCIFELLKILLFAYFVFKIIQFYIKVKNYIFYNKIQNVFKYCNILSYFILMNFKCKNRPSWWASSRMKKWCELPPSTSTFPQTIPVFECELEKRWTFSLTRAPFLQWVFALKEQI